MDQSQLVVRAIHEILAQGGDFGSLSTELDRVTGDKGLDRGIASRGRALEFLAGGSADPRTVNPSLFVGAGKVGLREGLTRDRRRRSHGLLHGQAPQQGDERPARSHYSAPSVL